MHLNVSKAFTLLELLVVITIIGVLTSIVAVSMSGSTDSAEIAKGKSYQQQIHALLGHEAVLDLNFNENGYDTCPGSTDLCDASGYGNNGTIYGDGDEYISSPVDGYALSLDGNNDYIGCGKIKDLGETTVTMWFNSSDSKLHNGGITFRPGLSYGHFDFNHDGGRPLLYLNNANYRYFSSSVAGFMDGSWHFMVLYIKGSGQYDITGATLSIDGEAILPGSTTASNSPLAWTGFDIGRMSYGYFHGLIDEVRVYSAALSSAEIQKHYVQGLQELCHSGFISKWEYDLRTTGSGFLQVSCADELLSFQREMI